MKDQKDNKIKVLVVDDSRVSQKLFAGIIATDNRFELIGTVSNGVQAIKAVKELKPDVVSMDINMPVMDGIDATRTIMQTTPLPIVVVSSLYNSSELELAVRVLEVGAVTIIPKPHGPGSPRFLSESRHYLRMLRAMSEVKVVTRRSVLSAKIQNQVIINETTNNSYEVMVIGSSAGGPQGVVTILKSIKPDFPLPVLIVQHISANFTEPFISWLQTNITAPIVMVKDDHKMIPGHIYISSPDNHLCIKSPGTVSIENSFPVKGHRPSVARLFSSAQKVYGGKVIAVLLSGMGNDGSEELLQLKNAGALTIAQNEESSLVFGMPGDAIARGAAIYSCNPDEMVKIIEKINYKR